MPVHMKFGARCVWFQYIWNLVLVCTKTQHNINTTLTHKRNTTQATDMQQQNKYNIQNICCINIICIINKHDELKEKPDIITVQNTKFTSITQNISNYTLFMLTTHLQPNIQWHKSTITTNNTELQMVLSNKHRPNILQQDAASPHYVTLDTLVLINSCS